MISNALVSVALVVAFAFVLGPVIIDLILGRDP